MYLCLTSIEVIDIFLRRCSTAICILRTSTSLVDALHDWVELCLNLLQLLVVVVLAGVGIATEELETLIAGSFNDLLVIVSELFLELLVIELVLNSEAVVFKLVPRLNFAFRLTVLVLELLCFLDHFLDLRLRQTTLVVGDGDAVTLASALLNCMNIQDAVSVDVERHFDLWSASWHRW